MKSFTRFFSKNRGNGRGMSPGVQISSGHLKNHLPAIRLGRHFPQAGNRAISQVVRLFSVAVHRLPFRKALTSENCGFVLCTKCGPCRTARKQFSKGLRSKTGVQQHPKNTQKRLFRLTGAFRGFREACFLCAGCLFRCPYGSDQGFPLDGTKFHLDGPGP